MRWIERGIGLCVLSVLAGCGSVGGSGLASQLTGLVTDLDGFAVAGADVRLGSRSATSLSNGSFDLAAVPRGFQKASAFVFIDGVRWSGETMVDIAEGERNRSLNIMVSPEATQGGMTGRVQDGNGNLIIGAKVFIGGPLGSTLAITGNDGRYTASRLPSGATYTATCSLAGYLNHTKSVTIDNRATTTVNFVLDTSAAQGPIPAPQNLSAQAWTVNSIVSRATGKVPGVYDWLRAQARRRKGLPSGPQGPARTVSAGRAVDGAIIEIDLFWDFVAYDDLFGYLIQRGANQGNLTDLAVVRDPLSRVFFDLDPLLNPGVSRVYAVSALDTIEFPDTGGIGPFSSSVAATPLPRCVAIGPIDGELTNGNPTLNWQSVAGAAQYRVYVYDRFPDLQSTTDPNGAKPIWPSDLANPGATLVSAPNTSVTYGGPALQSGHTYYWLVVAETGDQSAFSASSICRFEIR